MSHPHPPPDQPAGFPQEPLTIPADAKNCKELQSFTDSAPASDGPAAVELPAGELSDAKNCKELQSFVDSLPAERQASIRKLAAAALAYVNTDKPWLPFAERLSSRQQTAIELLLAGEPDITIAEKVGVHPSTLWRWEKNPVFHRALTAAREMAFGAAVSRLRCLVPQAVNILQDRLAEGDDLAAVRLLRLVRVDRHQDDPFAEPTTLGDRHYR